MDCGNNAEKDGKDAETFVTCDDNSYLCSKNTNTDPSDKHGLDISHYTSFFFLIKPGAFFSPFAFHSGNLSSQIPINSIIKDNSLITAFLVGLRQISLIRDKKGGKVQ